MPIAKNFWSLTIYRPEISDKLNEYKAYSLNKHVDSAIKTAEKHLQSLAQYPNRPSETYMDTIGQLDQTLKVPLNNIKLDSRRFKEEKKADRYEYVQVDLDSREDTRSMLARHRSHSWIPRNVQPSSRRMRDISLPKNKFNELWMNFIVSQAEYNWLLVDYEIDERKIGDKNKIRNNDRDLPALHTPKNHIRNNLDSE